MCLHPSRQIMSGPSFRTPALPGLRRTCKRWQALMEFDRLIATGIKSLMDLMGLFRTDRWLALIVCNLCQRQGVRQKVFHIRRPRFLVVINDGLQLSEQMRIAKTVLHGLQRQIGWPAIVNDRSCQSRRPCCTNQLRGSFYESSVVAGGYEQLVPYEVQDQELAFVQHGAKAARFAINLV